MRLAIILFALLSLSCGGVRIMPSQMAIVGAVQPPDVMRHMVRLYCEDRMKGWGTPVSANTLVTAYHVSECPIPFWLDGFGNRGVLTALRVDSKLDRVLFLSNRQFTNWVERSKRPLVGGELVWWYVILPGPTLDGSPVVGSYIGQDGDGQVHFWGLCKPGSSGSGVFNADGEIVAVVSGHYGEGKSNYTMWGNPIAAFFK